MYSSSAITIEEGVMAKKKKELPVVLWIEDRDNM